MKDTILLLICVCSFSYAKSNAQVQTFVFDSITNTFKVSEDINYAIGKEFPVFKAISLNNETISSDNLSGKVTMVNLWFEGCAPCIAELDVLINLYNKYKNNASFQFLSFTVDDFSVARKAVNKYNIPYSVYPISREDAYRMNFNSGFPTNMIINKEGLIESYNSGGSLEKEKVEMEIAKMDKIIADILFK